METKNGDLINYLISGLSKNELIGYFLILLAITSVFSVIRDLVWLAEGDVSTAV